jgi:hypothetical protein
MDYCLLDNGNKLHNLNNREVNYIYQMKFKLNNILQLVIIISIMLMTFLSKGQIFQQGCPDTIFTNYFRLNQGGWTAGD